MSESANIERIANELLRGCPDESLADHERIARALRRGDSKEQILCMSELNNWPETYTWLKAEFEHRFNS